MSWRDLWRRQMKSNKMLITRKQDNVNANEESYMR